MNIVILKWNPSFSSYTMTRFLNDLEKCALANKDDADMNWSIWNYEHAHEGDAFFMLKVGYGQTGIVAKGVLASNPYSGEDWAWRDRPTRYCDLVFDTMINPDAFPLLDSSTLSQAIPDFDWKGGHSGVVLTEAQAASFISLWNEYMERQADYFAKASDQNLFLAYSEGDASQLPYAMELVDNYSGHEVALKFIKGEVVHKLTISNYARTLGKFGVRSWRALNMLFRQAYPTCESLQILCSDLFKHQIEFSADFYKSSDSDD
ncbi:MAG: hypothetical protein NC548_63565 [Lachnospiraceae bacterium]|nr:hypothetical protein [Lachnospiraceae bacterium]